MPYSAPQQVMDEVEEMVPLYHRLAYTDLETEDLDWADVERSHLGARRLYKGLFPSGFGQFSPVDYVPPKEMPKDKIKYLMGVGEPTQIVEAVSRGIDCFDSRYPTMTARHNQIMTSKGNITIDKKEYAEDERPLDEECDCWVCKRFSRAYLYHLIKTREPNSLRYLTIHNLRFMMQLMENIRTSIKEGRFEEFKNEIKRNFEKKNK